LICFFKIYLKEKNYVSKDILSVNLINSVVNCCVLRKKSVRVS